MEKVVKKNISIINFQIIFSSHSISFLFAWAVLTASILLQIVSSRWVTLSVFMDIAPALTDISGAHQMPQLKHQGLQMFL